MCVCLCVLCAHYSPQCVRICLPVVQAFQDKLKRRPKVSLESEDILELETMKSEVLQGLGLKEDFLDNQFVRQVAVHVTGTNGCYAKWLLGSTVAMPSVCVC